MKADNSSSNATVSVTEMVHSATCHIITKMFPFCRDTSLDARATPFVCVDDCYSMRTDMATDITQQHYYVAYKNIKKLN